jgi:hypothetical protein
MEQKPVIASLSVVKGDRSRSPLFVATIFAPLSNDETPVIPSSYGRRWDD